MNRCLSEQALLQCYMGEGAADELVHLKGCLACSGRLKELEGDMGLITQALQAPPPLRHRAPAFGWVRWRAAASATAIAAAFVVGWALRGVAVSQFAGPVAPSASHAPIQISAREPTPAVYAAYVQDEFGGDSCSDANDPLGSGCL